MVSKSRFTKVLALYLFFLMLIYLASIIGFLALFILFGKAPKDIFIGFGLFLFIFVLMVCGFYKSAKNIEVSSDSITILNLIPPYCKHKYNIRDFDGYYLTKEKMRVPKFGWVVFEVAWFCKDSILKLRIPDRKYKNFHELLQATNLRYKGYITEKKWQVGDKVEIKVENIFSTKSEESLDKRIQSFLKESNSKIKNKELYIKTVAGDDTDFKCINWPDSKN